MAAPLLSLELRFLQNAAPLAVVGAAAVAGLQIDAAVDASLPSQGVPLLQLPDGYAGGPRQKCEKR